MRKFCKLEFEKSCTTETKTFTKITGFEKGECKEIEVCKYGHGMYIRIDKFVNVRRNTQVSLVIMDLAKGQQRQLLAMVLLSARRRPRRSARRCLSRRRCQRI